MNTEQTAVAPISAVPTTPLEQLHHDRSGLTRELASLNASAAKLRATAQAEAAVLQEIGYLGKAEIAATVAWASAGCIGNQPAPDQKHRRALAERLSAAQAASAAAVGAGQDLDHQIGQLNAQLVTLDQMIETAALDLMDAEADQIINEYTELVERENEMTAKLIGLSRYFSDEGRKLTDRGDHQAGRRYFAKASTLSANKLIEHGATMPMIDAAATAWSKRAAALRRGSPS